MIKLEDLKLNDEVYYIYKYHWCRKLTIIQEKDIFPYNYGEDFIYYTEARNENGGFEKLFSYNENDLFKTREEAEKTIKEVKTKRKAKLIAGDNLIQYLFSCAKDKLSTGEEELILEILEERKQSNE